MAEFTRRVTGLEPEGAYQVLARAQDLEAQGREVIHLEIGQPDFQTFPHISLRGIQAIAEGQTRYNPPAGLTELRKVIAVDVSKRRGIEIEPNQVVVGPGAKPGLFFPTLALIEPGDEVIYPDPGFPTYRAMVEVAGGVPVPVPLSEENRFSFDLGSFEELVDEKTKLIILNTPANPTGGVIPVSDLEVIASAAEENNCWILSDEIYARLAYDGLIVPSILSLPDMLERSVLVDGYSKTYAMTGWRLGYAVMPQDLAERVELLLTHSIGCTATFTQVAGIEAITADQGMVAEVVAEFQRRRDHIVAGLNEIPGVKCQTPQGAFYVFPNVKSYGLPVREIARSLLDEVGIAVLPGTDFGQYGEGYLRMCYATSINNIDKALTRISSFFEEIDK